MKPSGEPEREYRIIAAGEFKARCLQLMDEVFAHRNLSVIITKRGRPVAMMTAPPDGMKLSGPSVAPGSFPVAPVTAVDKGAAAAVEEHRRKKRKRKKKHK